MLTKGMSYRNSHENIELEPKTSLIKPNYARNKQEIDLNPLYKKKTLKEELETFVKESKKKNPNGLHDEYNQLQISLSQYSQKLHDDYGEDLNISYIEHSYYIFSVVSHKNSYPEELSLMANSKLEHFEAQNMITPKQDYYELIEAFIKFASELICNWGIFDIHNYGYRYEGRSLSVKTVNMRSVNSQCITIDVLWFIFAIKHKPFVGMISNVLVCYAKVLEMAMNQLIEFFKDEKLNVNAFGRHSFWWRLIRKNDEQGEKLFCLLKSVELAYRQFEKCLLEEFLKLI